MVNMIMKRNYIKMNNNDKYLSFGNVVRVIKEVSNNKNAMQLEIFSSIFDINNVNITTINNYCIGIRAIGIEYKKIFSDKYKNDKRLFLTNILALLSILDDKIYFINDNSYNEINHNSKLKLVIDKLLEIAKNDEAVSSDFIKSIKKMDLYDSIIELLNYSINKNIQPLYKQDINIKINKGELDDYLKIKLYYGQSNISSLINLAEKNNMYACADLGSLWFDGLVDGSVNFNKSYDYYLKAAIKGHPKACWMIANLMLTKRVRFDMNTMWEYLNKSIEYGSAAGYNTLGLCYKNGINPDNKKDIDLAKKNFELSSELGYVFAFNNIGLLYEEDNMKEAVKYYKISADMGNSWALNKMGEYYRNCNDLVTAYMYYSKAIECPLNERNRYAYYNLAEYYYKNGNKELNIEKDNIKYKYYMEMFDRLKK